MCLRQPCLFAILSRVGEENLAGHSENIRFRKSLQQRREKIGRNPHVAIQQDNNVVACFAKAPIRSTTKAEILCQGNQLHTGKSRSYKFGAPVAAPVIHHNHFVIGVG